MSSFSDSVAQSMFEIVNSSEHKKMFRLPPTVIKTASKACCPCLSKCKGECPCKYKCAKDCSCHKDHNSASDCESCGDGMMTTSAMKTSLFKISESCDRLGNVIVAEAALKMAQMIDLMSAEMLPLLDTSLQDGSDVELSSLEDDVDDPAQVKNWLEESKRKSTFDDKSLTSGIDNLFDPEQKLTFRPDQNPDPNDLMTLENSSLEDEFPLSKTEFAPPSDRSALMADWGAPKSAPDTEKEYKELQKSHNVDFGNEFEEGGWELPSKLKGTVIDKSNAVDKDSHEEGSDIPVFHDGTSWSSVPKDGGDGGFDLDFEDT